MSHHDENRHHDPNDPNHEHGHTHPHGPGGHEHGHGHSHEHAHGDVTHEHPHSHECGPSHDHCHGAEMAAQAGQPAAPGGLTERQKLVKMVQHWAAHSDDHTKSYRAWVERCRALGEIDAATTLDKIADSSDIQTEKFRLLLAMLGERTA